MRYALSIFCILTNKKAFFNAHFSNFPHPTASILHSPFPRKYRSLISSKEKYKNPAAEFHTEMQTAKPLAIVLNLEEFIEKKAFSGEGSFSTNNMSLATDKRQVDDLSLVLTDLSGTNEDDKSLMLEHLEEDGEESTAADSAAFSESANSSANFSFTNESCANTDSYPALYAPEQQQEYEAMKAIQERKEKYGILHPFAGFIQVFYNGGMKINNSVSSFAKSVHIDKWCTA